jgi:hypothetical protein
MSNSAETVVQSDRITLTVMASVINYDTVRQLNHIHLLACYRLIGPQIIPASLLPPRVSRIFLFYTGPNVHMNN